MQRLPTAHLSTATAWQAPRFEALETWRGLAAIAVALYHSPFNSHLVHTRFFEHAYLFVDFFFVLSGFVMSHAYSDRLRSGREVAVFVLRRFGRLWPLHAAVLLLMVAGELAKLVAVSRLNLVAGQMPFTGTTSVPDLVYNLLLLHSVGIVDHITWNVPSWSISVEFYTAILFALCASTLGRRTWVLALVLCAISGGVILANSPHQKVMDVSFDYGLPRCILGFFAGHLTYRLFQLRRMRMSSLAEIGTLIGVGLFIAFAGGDAWSVAAPVVFSAGVYVFAQQSGAVSAFLARPRFQAIGALSYSIYLLHIFTGIVIVTILRYGERLLGGDWFERVNDGQDTRLIGNFTGGMWVMDAFNVVYVGCAVLGAMVTFRLVEQPARRFFVSASKRVQTGRVSVPAVLSRSV